MVMSEGNTILKAIAYDIDGINPVSGIYSWNYNIDTSEPIVTSNVNSGTYYNMIHDIAFYINKNGTIYYTTNGSNPNNQSTLYTGNALMVHSGTSNYKIIAYDSTGRASDIYNFTYTVDTSKPVIIPSIAPGIHYNQIHNLKLASSKNGTIYYTTNGSTPNTQSELYDGNIMIHTSDEGVLKIIAYDTTGRASNIYNFTYKIDENQKQLFITPNIPQGTYYSEIHTLNITSNTNRPIYYTTDGTKPTNNSNVYNGKIIMVHHSQTLNFATFDDGGYSSNIFSLKYVINKNPINIKPVNTISNKNIKINLSKIANGTIYYSINGANFKKYISPFTISKSSKVAYYGVDSLKHKSNVKVINYKIDKIKPRVTATSIKKNKIPKNTNKITIKFNEKLYSKVNQPNKYIKIVNLNNKKYIKANISISNNKVIINNFKLKSKQKYKILIQKNIFKDGVNNMNDLYAQIFVVK